ncbi:uncharacterized protein LOC142568328 isoform X1 [Dermacentor variabilis]|uniref:uncharacterized protein LOC142568328 isoform X1 n=1 Tax=Dermacentor variabilis TaxID=34621 RepID=UPI003F5B0CE4
MAALPRMTVYRRVRRAVQEDLNLILSAEVADSCLTEAPGTYSTTDGVVRPAAESFQHSLSESGGGPSCDILTPLELPEADVSTDEVRACLDSPPRDGGPCNSTVEQMCSLGDNALSQGDQPNTVSFKEKLQVWCIERDVPHVTITHLLQVMHSHACFSGLPKSARALLSTPRLAYGVKPMGSGQYCHFGLTEGLQEALKNVLPVPDPLILHVNVDGLPLTKSTRDQFWPILCRAANCESSKPFPIGIYYGQSKALQPNTFLQQFVFDLKIALHHGVTVGSQLIHVELGAIICDAPAKAYILGIKGHSGYFSCPKCTTEGNHKHGRMCFPELDAPLRTDASFRNVDQEDHHIMDTILKDLPIDLIRQVPLDYMHLTCLGVVRKLLLLWIKGEKTYRIGKRSRESVSGASTEIRHYVPSEMSRKPRSLSDIDRWKASEFRLLMLYTGPVVLKSRIPDNLADNFMVLHVAMSILCSPLSCTRNLEYAERLLVHFVKVFIEIYGEHAVSLNVHCLVHVVDDVRVHGPLHGYSAFPFENYMPRLKKYVRKPEKPLQQLYNRIMEERALGSMSSRPETCIALDSGSVCFTEKEKLLMRHDNGPLPLGCVGPQYKGFLFSQDATIKVNKRDCTCMLNDGSIVKVENFAVCAVSHMPVLVGRKYQKLEDLYTYPCKSSLINIFLASNLSDIHFWPVSDITLKCVRLPFGRKHAVFPMRHLQ